MKHSRAALRQIEWIREEYGIEDSPGKLILENLAKNLDTEQNAMKIVKAQGMLIKGDRGQTKAHPLLPVIRDARAQILQCIKMLNLDVEVIKPVGRPPGR